MRIADASLPYTFLSSFLQPFSFSAFILPFEPFAPPTSFFSSQNLMDCVHLSVARLSLRVRNLLTWQIVKNAIGKRKKKSWLETTKKNGDRKGRKFRTIAFWILQWREQGGFFHSNSLKPVKIQWKNSNCSNWPKICKSNFLDFSFSQKCVLVEWFYKIKKKVISHQKNHFHHFYNTFSTSRIFIFILEQTIPYKNSLSA